LGPAQKEKLGLTNLDVTLINADDKKGKKKTNREDKKVKRDKGNRAHKGK